VEQIEARILNAASAKKPTELSPDFFSIVYWCGYKPLGYPKETADV
jgi:hypothetical protein